MTTDPIEHREYEKKLLKLEIEHNKLMKTYTIEHSKLVSQKIRVSLLNNKLIEIEEEIKIVKADMDI